MRDALEHRIDACQEPVTRAIRRLNGVLDHTGNAPAKQAKELLEAARRELKHAAQIEQGHVCRDCGGEYTREGMDVERVPQWGKTFYVCPHCGAHKQEI